MKENKAFRIPFITKKQLKSRQAFAQNVLETPIQSIQRCLNPLFQRILFWCSLAFKNISPPGQNQQMVISVVYLPCHSRLASRLTLTFIRHLTLINRNLIKERNQSSLSNKVETIPYFQCIQQIPVCIYIICTFFIVIILNIFVCSYCCKLFVIIFFTYFLK